MPVTFCLVLALVAACGGEDGPGSASPPGGGGTRLSAREIAGKMNCFAFKLDQDTELFVREQGGCAFAEDEQDTYPVTIYVFTDSKARDNWLEAASAFGGGPLVVGTTWVVAVGTTCDPKTPCSAEERALAIQALVGGEIR